MGRRARRAEARRSLARALRRARPFLAPLLVALVAVFLGRALYESWDDVRGYEWRFQPGFLAASAVLIGLYYLQQWGGWRLVMRSFGDPLERADSMHIWYSTILGRYVPGSVAMVAGRVGLCRKRGIPASTTLASIIYENALILITALLVTAATVPFWPDFRREAALPLAVLAPVCLGLLHPAVFGYLANVALRRAGRGPLGATLSFGRVLALIPYYVMGWALLGLGFAALAASVAPVRPEDLALLVGGYAFAWEVGFLSVVVPSGIGVKEGVLTAISGLAFPLPVAAALAALSRLWQTLAELAAAALAWGFTRTRRRVRQRLR